MKTVLIILCLGLLTACNGLVPSTPKDIQLADEVCKVNGGLRQMHTTMESLNVVCNNTASFQLNKLK